MPKFNWKRWLLSTFLFRVLPIVLLLFVFIVLVNSNRQSLLLRGSSGFLHHFTGFRNTVGSAEFLASGGGYLIKDIRMRNPNVFRVRPEFATIKTLLIELEKPPKKDGKVMISRMVLDIDNINVVLWDRGVLNLSYLSGMRKKTNEMLGLETVEDKLKQEDYFFLIRRLEVTIGKVSYTDTTGRRSAQSVEFSGERNFVFTDLRGIPEVIRAVCALIVADRPIPSENLPVNTYVAQFLGLTGKQSASANQLTSEKEYAETEQAGFNPNMIGQSDVSDEEVQLPQETYIIELSSEEVETPPAEGDIETQPQNAAPAPATP